MEEFALIMRHEWVKKSLHLPGTSENIVSLETAMGLMWKVFAPNFGRDFNLRILRREKES